LSLRISATHFADFSFTSSAAHVRTSSTIIRHSWKSNNGDTLTLNAIICEPTLLEAIKQVYLPKFSDYVFKFHNNNTIQSITENTGGLLT